MAQGCCTSAAGVRPAAACRRRSASLQGATLWSIRIRWHVAAFTWSFGCVRDRIQAGELGGWRRERTEAPPV